MKIVNQKFEHIYNEDPQKHIEEIARTCYKSESAITDVSNKIFISKLYKMKHWAMLEHFIFIYEILLSLFTIFKQEKYINVTEIQEPGRVRYIAAFSARSLLDLLNKYPDGCMKIYKDIRADIIRLIEQILYDYNCTELFGDNYQKVNYPYMFKKLDKFSEKGKLVLLNHRWESVKFTCDRGVSHEIVRHRDASFAQESTRYCNYAKDKFGNEITVIEPCYLKDSSDNVKEVVAWEVWKKAIENSEKSYFEMLDLGCTAQEARSVLPNSLKTELVMTARLNEWRHFFDLRCDKGAHPMIRDLATKLLVSFNDIYPESFSDLFNKYIS